MGAGSSRGSFTEAELVSGLAAGRFRNIVILCGAGISTSAGIPDFRSPSAGLYFKLRKYNLPYPEAVFEGGYFRQNPLPFYSLIRELFPTTLAPTTTHKFFSLLHQQGLLRRVYTQNIDALEHLAGLPESHLVEAHGSFKSSYCTVCGAQYDLRWLKAEIFQPEGNEGVPRCLQGGCGGVVRPDVVLFGEALPGRFWQNITEDFRACDLLLVFGTSLVVAPFNSLVTKPGRGVPRVYVNLSKPGSAGVLGWLLSMGGNVDFSRESDLVVLGDCDRTVERLCGAVPGWQQLLDRVEVNTLDHIT